MGNGFADKSTDCKNYFSRMKTHFFILFTFLVAGIANGQTSQQLPEGTRSQYVKYIDNSISDEFNGNSPDFKKWGRRNTGGYAVMDHYRDSSLVLMKSELDEGGQKINYISMLGIGEEGPLRTAGIVSRASGYYGFYVVRFRYNGFDNEKTREHGNIWHPSVWAARTDHIDGVERSTCDPGFWIEIDMVEWAGHGWSCDAPARIIDSKGVNRKVITRGPGLEKCIMKGDVERFGNSWQTIGLEYTPEYFKVWEWKDEKWSHIGDRVVKFVEEDPDIPEKSYTIGTMGKRARTPVFWILGNVVSRYLYPLIEDGTVKKAMNNMTVDFDYFRYYRHKSAENMDWPWENELPDGGGKIQIKYLSKHTE